MTERDKAHFLAREGHEPELAEEACRFLLQPSIVRGTFAYWARRAGA
jgi:hypothetical protein